jgi:hypothetical protein
MVKRNVPFHPPFGSWKMASDPHGDWYGRSEAIRRMVEIGLKAKK